MRRAFIFPGQGSQYVGMGRILAESFSESREVFEEVDESVGRSLTRIMFEGPESDLNLTENAQPALMAVSMAVIRVLQKQGGIDIARTCSFVAGHSLGEYSALTAAGSFTLSDAFRLLNLRGRAMQKAVPEGAGSMAAILGLSLDDVRAVAAESSGREICAVANDNCDGQVVVSGHKGAVESAIALAMEKGAKRAVALPVSVPAHCPLMGPAAKVMADALGKIDILRPLIPIVFNVTAQGETDPAVIRRLLVEQITGLVRWRESVLWMKDKGVAAMFEIGAGKVLSGLVRRIDRDIACESVETPEQIEALIAGLQ